MGKMTMGRSNTAPVKQIMKKQVAPVIETKIVEKQTIIEVPVEHHHHHTKTINVTHENTKTRDDRARKYTKAMRQELTKVKEEIQTLDNRVVALESRKPEEKQVVTIEKHNTEVIREVSPKMDKRLLALVIVSMIMNTILILMT